MNKFEKSRENVEIIYSLINDICQKNNGVCKESNKFFSQKFNVSAQTINSYLRKLKKMNKIDVSVDRFLYSPNEMPPHIFSTRKIQIIKNNVNCDIILPKTRKVVISKNVKPMELTEAQNLIKKDALEQQKKNFEYERDERLKEMVQSRSDSRTYPFVKSPKGISLIEKAIDLRKQFLLNNFNNSTDKDELLYNIAKDVSLKDNIYILNLNIFGLFNYPIKLYDFLPWDKDSIEIKTIIRYFNDT